MESNEVEGKLRDWLSTERIEFKEQSDPRADLHLLIKYPLGENGHKFVVIIPKGRDLVAVSSMTRVDGGQQDKMKELMEEDSDEWKNWLHECRMQLIASGVDWGIHLGHSKSGRNGPLQAFNVSEPIWFDGLTKNELMQTIRRLWLSKLGLIHEIKFAFGKGNGKPGPVDDWENKKQSNQRIGSPSPPKPKQVHIDESMSFGDGFDPEDWI